MKVARELVPLSAPLKDVRLVRSGSRSALHQEDLQSSYERGRIEGERALGEQLVRQRAELLELQSGVLASLQAAIPQVARECERALVELALEAAQRLVGGLPLSAEMIEAAVREACAAVQDTSDFTVQLHPDDLALLERAHSPLLLPQGAQDRIRFQPASAVSRGGCLVQTRFGVIDARRETKFEILRQTLLA
jgi:flagellar assembly protein FliH